MGGQKELRDLIRRMSKEKPEVGSIWIDGELLMLGFEVAQSTVSKYMVPGGSPSLRPAEGGATGYNSATLQHTSGNSTAIKEAVAVGYPREKMYRVWWSGAEQKRRSRPAVC
jgi:hypothetical protein